MTADRSSNKMTKAVEVGEGAFRYRVAENWPTLPAGWNLIEVVAVATDSQERVYVFNRGKHPVAVFSPAGDLFKMPQGSTALDFASAIHTEVGNHCVGARVNGKQVPLRH